MSAAAHERHAGSRLTVSGSAATPAARASASAASAMRASTSLANATASSVSPPAGAPRSGAAAASTPAITAASAGAAPRRSSAPDDRKWMQLRARVTPRRARPLGARTSPTARPAAAAGSAPASPASPTPGRTCHAEGTKTPPFATHGHHSPACTQRTRRGTGKSRRRAPPARRAAPAAAPAPPQRPGSRRRRRWAPRRAPPPPWIATRQRQTRPRTPRRATAARAACRTGTPPRAPAGHTMHTDAFAHIAARDLRPPARAAPRWQCGPSARQTRAARQTTGAPPPQRASPRRRGRRQRMAAAGAPTAVAASER